MRITFGKQTSLQSILGPLGFSFIVYTHQHPTVLPGGRTSRSQVPFCFRANISSFMTFFQPEIDRAFDIDLRTNYESKEEIKAWKERDKYE